MISLLIPAGGNLARVQKMLAEEYGTATQIKSHVNSLSVQSAIRSTQQRLGLYSRGLPANGLVIYCGTCTIDGRKERKLSLDFEPFKPLKKSLYWCGNRFQTEVRASALQERCYAS